MGKSYLEYAVDPFILGVYAGDPGKLVPKYALPKLYKLEQQFGSFIGGAFKRKFRPKSEWEKKATREVFSVKGGLQSLVNTLHEKSGKDHYRLNAKEVKIVRGDDSWQVSFSTDQGKTEIYYSKYVIVTTGSHELASIMPEMDRDQMNKLTDLRYASVIEVALGFRDWRGMDHDGFGGLIPFKEKRDLLGILFPSTFLEGRAPAGGALFTIFMGGIRRPELFEKGDEEIFEIVKREFTELMGIDRFEPELFRTFRYRFAIPQYERSSGTRFRVIEELERDLPGLLLRGNFQGGIGLADRIRQGKLAAEKILKHS